MSIFLFVLILLDSLPYCTGFGKSKNPWAIPTCHLERHPGPPAAPWLLLPSPPPADPKWCLHSQRRLQWDPGWACHWRCALHPSPDHLLPTPRWVEWFQLWHGFSSQQATAYQRRGGVSWALCCRLFPFSHLLTPYSPHPHNQALLLVQPSILPSSSLSSFQSGFLREGEIRGCGLPNVWPGAWFCFWL